MTFYKFCFVFLVGFILMYPLSAQRQDHTFGNEHHSPFHNAEPPTDPVHPEVRAVMKKNYQASRKFSMGAAAVMLDGRWGFIDNSGIEITPVDYDFVCDYWASSTMAKKENTWYLIDRNGKLIKTFQIDFFDGFRNGSAKIFANGKMTFINERGEMLAPGWQSEPDGRHRPAYPSLQNLNAGCPANIDFEFGDFRNWTSQVGRVQCVSNVYSLTSMAVVNPPVTDHIEIIDNVAGQSDPYGPIPVRPFDGSLHAMKIGNDNDETALGLCCPSRYAEKIEYPVQVPPAPTNFNIIYDYAIVLEEPTNGGHDPCERPRFSIEIKDVATGQTVPCGFVEYFADSASIASGGFIQSAIPPRNPSANQGNSGVVWYKPWSSVFVNLSKYAGSQINIIFTATDCTLGGHWGYAYLDIRGCETALNAYNTCNTPVRTVLEGPPGFSFYQWYDSSYSTVLSTSRYQALNNSLPLGSTVHLIYSINNTASCMDTLHAVITNQRINWNAGPDKSICPGDNTVIGSPPASHQLYSWSPAAHLSSVNQAQVTASPLNDFRYIVNVRDTVSGCVLRDTVFIDMVNRPDVHVNDLAICEGQEGVLTATGADEYFWTPDPTLFVNPQNNAMATVRPTVNTRYIVRGNMTGSSCYGRDTATVTLVPDPVVSITGPSSSLICLGQSVQLQAQSSQPGRFQWYFGDPSGSTPPAPIPGATGSLLNASQSGNYFVVGTNTTGCPDTALHPLQLQTILKPTPSFTFSSYCVNLPVQFNNTSNVANAGAVTYDWDFGDNSPHSGLTNPVHTYNPAGNYTVTLRVTPTLCPGLFETRSLVIPVESPLSGIRYPDVYTVRNSNRQLQARTFAVNYLWMPSTGLSNASVSNPRFNYNRDMKYLIRLTAASGCETVDTQFVYLRAAPDIRVPTAFSPNGDGHNDILDVFLIDIRELKWFRVFNRWGQLLFETNDPRQLWDGTFKGIKQPAETYVWTAQGIGFDGSEIIRRGQCVLLR